MTAFPVPGNHLHWWLVTGTRWRRLHAIPASVFDQWDEDTVGALCRHPGPTASALCGYEGGWRLPGMLTRLGQARCAQCCDRLGIGRGHGTPVNEGA